MFSDIVFIICTIATGNITSIVVINECVYEVPFLSKLNVFNVTINM